MGKLFQFRFEEGENFKGHNFGNLFILAMLKVTGDFEKAIRESSKILAIRGRVVPSTLKKSTLVAQHADGTQTIGESNISMTASKIERLYLQPEGSHATEDAIFAVENADAIVIGPGSLYTSILPNLLIEDLSAAIARARAPKIYICNVMTQTHETDGFSAFDHVNTIAEHSHPDVLSHVIVNAGQIPPNILVKYSKGGSIPVKPDTERIRALGYRVVEDNIINAADIVRHNPRRVSKLILEIINTEKKRNVNDKKRRKARLLEAV